MSIKSSYSKDALNYFDKGSNEKEDVSKRAIGWQGRDIKKINIGKKIYI